jgi:hypothetical protein
MAKMAYGGEMAKWPKIMALARGGNIGSGSYRNGGISGSETQ